MCRLFRIRGGVYAMARAWGLGAAIESVSRLPLNLHNHDSGARMHSISERDGTDVMIKKSRVQLA
jgi:hypothetical protein